VSAAVARIVFSDDGLAFDGRTPEAGPLGGSESAIVGIAEALAARGHAMAVRNRCAAPLVYRGVDWAPLGTAVDGPIDLHIASRGHRMLGLFPAARRLAFWLTNPAQYLMKRRYLMPLWRLKPALIFLGPHHAASYPRWAPGGARHVIPLAVDEVFRAVPAQAGPPPPRAVFASNPQRGLDWLLDLWVRRIRPAVPAAELHVYSGAATYGGANAAMDAIVARAEDLGAAGVVRHPPAAKPALAAAYGRMRAMLYRGDPGETFCMALAEAQAAGLPCVVRDIGCVAERVVDGVTGTVARNDDAFAAAAIRILTDDAQWRAQHAAAPPSAAHLTWDGAAQGFERLLP